MGRDPVAAISTLGEYRSAGVVLVSHCSADRSHSHCLDLDELIATHGADRQVDHSLKRAIRCPECGALLVRNP